MRFKILLSSFSIAIVFFTSCASEQSKFFVAQFDDEVISQEQFKDAYTKQFNFTDEVKDTADSAAFYDFVDKYLAYNLKLKDAKERGFDKDPITIAEVEKYKNEIGAPYFWKKYVKDPGLKDLYNKRKTEIRVSHIMFRKDKIGEEAAKAKADSVLKLALAGANFDSLAAVYSDDTYTKKSGGDIYYITAGQIIPAFEKVAYKLNAGEIYPELVKSAYGYHIVKVTEKHPRIYKLKARHILIKPDIKDTTEAAWDSALVKIKDVQKQLRNGADFATLAKEYSDDLGSGANGGLLEPFERRTMVREFDEAAFRLKEGEISNIIKSKYGYHIIKLEKIIDMPSFENSKAELTKIFDKYEMPIAKKAVYDSLKSEFNYSDNYDEIVSLIKSDTNRIAYDSSYWKSDLHDKISSIPAFVIAGDTLASDSLFKAAELDKVYKGKTISEYNFGKLFGTVNKAALLSAKINKLEKEDKEFANLLNEYTNGIYIFKLQESEVWNKLKIDSTKLPALYEQTKEQYTWPDRVSFIELFSVRKDSLEKMYETVKSGKVNFEEFAALKTERRSKRKEGGKYQLVEASENKLNKKAFAQEIGEVSEPFKIDYGWSIIKTIFKDSARLKTYKEALPQVISVFQGQEAERLEKEYVQKLKEKYSPIINYKNAKEAIK